MRRFLKKVALPPGTPYAILTTEAGPKPDKKTGRMPTEEELAKAEQELAKYQRVRPIMNEILQGKGLVSVAEDKVHVTGLQGPLEEGWQATRFRGPDPGHLGRIRRRTRRRAAAHDRSVSAFGHITTRLELERNRPTRQLTVLCRQSSG